MGGHGKTFLGKTETKELMEDEVECKDGICKLDLEVYAKMLYLYCPKQ